MGQLFVWRQINQPPMVALVGPIPEGDMPVKMFHLGLYSIRNFPRWGNYSWVIYCPAKNVLPGWAN